MDACEDMARRIADCLEAHLHEFGWEPYRYPSGEHKGVALVTPGTIILSGAEGGAAIVTVAPAASTPS